MALRVESFKDGARLVDDATGAVVELPRDELAAIVDEVKAAAAPDVAALRLAVVEAAMAEPLDRLRLHAATLALLESKA